MAPHKVACLFIADICRSTDEINLCSHNLGCGMQ